MIHRLEGGGYCNGLKVLFRPKAGASMLTELLRFPAPGENPVLTISS